MKLREFFYAAGFKPAPKEFPFDLDAFTLPREGRVEFARWRHPKEQRKVISQGAVDALRRFLREGDVAVDIGAHSGDTTVPLALAVGRAGAVFALEPNPYAFKVLLANSALNRKTTNIIPLMFAATPEDGEFEFEYSDAGFCNGGMHAGISKWKHAHFFKLQVQGRNLVNYLKREYPGELARVRYVKIDTEGFDRAVAASLRELLAANRPFLRSEIFGHLSESERAGYFRDLLALGYTIHKLNSDEDYEGEVLTERDVMRWPHFDIFAVPA